MIQTLSGARRINTDESTTKKETAFASLESILVNK